MKRETKNLLVAAGLLAAFAGIGTGVYKMTRGIRNNNPGNIRRTSDKWRGLAAEQTDPEYFVFSDPVYGIRAMAKLLRNYNSRYGLTTLTDIISRWAPPSENPTNNYIEFASRSTGVPENAPFNFDDDQDLAQLIKAIIKFENGQNPYSTNMILKGIELA